MAVGVECGVVSASSIGGLADSFVVVVSGTAIFAVGTIVPIGWSSHWSLEHSGQLLVLDIQ